MRYPILRAVFVFLGTVSVILGIIGIFVPLMPTTVFLLLAAYFYARSSKRFLDWLLNNPVFGEYIRNYREGRGIPLKQKILTLSLLWLTLLTTGIYFVNEWWLRGMLLVIGAGVTIHLVLIKTRTRNERKTEKVDPLPETSTN